MKIFHRVQEDEQWTVKGGKFEQLLQIGGDWDGVVRDVLEGQHVAVTDLLADGLQERPQSSGVGCGPTEPAGRLVYSSSEMKICCYASFLMT